jgi:hypothetical protein
VIALTVRQLWAHTIAALGKSRRILNATKGT